jgi:hypothetical protein
MRLKRDEEYPPEESVFKPLSPLGAAIDNTSFEDLLKFFVYADRMQKLEEGMMVS